MANTSSSSTLSSLTSSSLLYTNGLDNLQNLDNNTSTDHDDEDFILDEYDEITSIQVHDDHDDPNEMSIGSIIGKPEGHLEMDNIVPIVTPANCKISLQKQQVLSSLSNSHEERRWIPTLGYWKIRGFAQPIRFLLAYLQINFQDKWYEIGEDLSRESWLKEKFTLGLELPNLPYWIDKKTSTKLTQSRAILRHLARETEPPLLGSTVEEQRRIDMLENHIWDFWLALVSLCFRFTEKDKECFLCSLPIQFQQLSDFIGTNKWCISDNISFVDFMVYEALYQHKVFEPNCLNGYPTLQRLLNQFESLPTISEYMKSPNFIEKPLYTRLATYYI